MRVVGPNCMGVINVRRRILGTFTPSAAGFGLVPGRISLVSQSGAFGGYCLSLIRQRGLGLNLWVTTGNQSDVDFADCVSHFAQDEGTQVIVGYIEAATDKDRLIAALDLARENGKRIVVMKVGSSEAGALHEDLCDAASALTMAIAELVRAARLVQEAIVESAGGNDVDSYYPAIYKGAASAKYINATRDNLRFIVDYVRKVKGTIPIVLVSVPHVGCTPDIQKAHPTDPVKTQRVTAALDSLNAQLALFAKQRGIAFVPGVYELTKSLITQPLRIGGMTFISQADADSRPEYLFSGDGFHPNTCAHAKIAQMIIEAFRTRYPASNITPLGDAEILQTVLK